MSRFAQTETALLERLRVLKAAPDVSIKLSDISVAMYAAGFTDTEIKAVLEALEQDKILAVAPGKRVQILKDLPC
jgi:hypothetical protein